MRKRTWNHALSDIFIKIDPSNFHSCREGSKSTECVQYIAIYSGLLSECDIWHPDILLISPQKSPSSSVWLLLLNKICKVPYFNTSLFRSESNNQRVIFTNQSTTNLFVSFEGLVTSVDTALEPSCGLTSFNSVPVTLVQSFMATRQSMGISLMTMKSTHESLSQRRRFFIYD